MPARWYQAEAIDSVLFAWEEYQRVLLNSPTGSGKNFMAANILLGVHPKRFLFIGDRDELCAQPAEAISQYAGIIPHIEKGSKRAPLTAKVVVASAQTLSRTKRLEAYPSDFFDYIVADEAHRLVDQKEKIFSYFGRAKVCGLTATPFRASLSDLTKWYEEVAFNLPMLNLIAEGFAPPFEVVRPPIEIDISQVKTSIGIDGKDFDAESFSTTIAPYYAEIAESLADTCADRHTVSFLPLIKSSEAFAAIARSVGMNAIHVDGKSADRTSIIEGFKVGRYSMICNSNLLGTGTDMPIADCMANIVPMHSPVEWQQRFGRIMRVLPGLIDDIPGKHQAAERRERIANSSKPMARVVDFLWQHAKLGVYRPEFMVAANAAEGAAMFEKSKGAKSPIDILAIQRLVQQEREAAVVKALEEAAYKSEGNTLDPEVFGFLIGSSSIVGYEPAARWECDSPTKPQLAKLKEWGIDVEQVKSKGQASKLMDACIHRMKYRLATVGQLQAIAKLGIRVNPKKLSSGEASRLIRETKLSAIREPSI